MTKLALIVEADATKIKQTHPVLLGKGTWKLVSAREIKSRISVFYQFPILAENGTAEMPGQTTIDGTILGPAKVVLFIEEAVTEKLTIFAEKVA